MIHERSSADIHISAEHEKQETEEKNRGFRASEKSYSLKVMKHSTGKPRHDKTAQYCSHVINSRIESMDTWIIQHESSLRKAKIFPSEETSCLYGMLFIS